MSIHRMILCFKQKTAYGMRISDWSSDVCSADLGRKYDATVVLYDWERDIAVLDVPDLNAPVLQFTTEVASSGKSAIVAGFPENGRSEERLVGKECVSTCSSLCRPYN